MRKKKEGWREDTVESVSNRRDSGNICDPLTLSGLFLMDIRKLQGQWLTYQQ